MVKKLEWIEMAQLAVSSILFSKRNAWQSSSYWERLRCGEPCSNICCITMKRGTIRAKAIASCFLCRRRQEGTREQCGVENDWAACSPGIQMIDDKCLTLLLVSSSTHQSAVSRNSFCRYSCSEFAKTIALVAR